MPFVRPTVVFLGQDIQVGKGTVISDFVVVHNHVKIGDNCYIGPFTVLGNHSSQTEADMPLVSLLIGNECWIGPHSWIEWGQKIPAGTVLPSGSHLAPEPDIKRTWWQKVWR